MIHTGRNHEKIVEERKETWTCESNELIPPALIALPVMDYTRSHA